MFSLLLDSTKQVTMAVHVYVFVGPQVSIVNIHKVVSVKFEIKIVTPAALPTATGSRGPRGLRQELCSLGVRIPLEAGSVIATG
jgi:hypothetical protein